MTEGSSAASAAPGKFALAVTMTNVELELINKWLRSGGMADPDAVRVLSGTVEELADLLPDEGDGLVTPLRVVWLPRERDGARQTRWSDLAALANPHRPGQRRQRHIVDREPDRYRVIAGEPATLSDLRKRYETETQGPSDPVAFARYVRRAAVVTLARSERQIIGERYKAPRLVAEQILDRAAYCEELAELAMELELTEDEIRQRAADCLDELVAVQSRIATDLWSGIMSPLHSKTWRVDVDGTGLDQLRELNKRHALIFLPSHRSYADPLVLAGVLASHDFPRNHVMGGSNLSFWPFAPLARRAGVVFIRRSFGDDDVYKSVVQEYFAHLLSKRFNLEWYFEGGRSRTGKLRPPRFGLLRYVAAAIQAGRTEDVYLVPVSITYERLPEVSAMSAEQSGGAKKKEGLAWLAKYARSQSRSSGAVYVRFGESFPVRDRLAAEGATEDEQRIALQKVAFDVAVGINNAAPVTPNALMALTLLGVRDEALTVEQIRRVLAPILDYVEVRKIPAIDLDVLREAAGISGVLGELDRAGVVTAYAGGEEPVFSIAPGKHLDAAFYRNNAIHWFVNRAIIELSMLHVADSGDKDPIRAGWEEAKRLRDQLKFEFFFPDRDTFEAELTEEMRLITHNGKRKTGTSEEVRALLGDSGFLMAHRVLRSFLDAQLVVMERLAALDPSQTPESKSLLDDCEAVGKQMLLQGRLHGPESLSRELFGAAIQLADNYALIQPGGEELREQRQLAASRAREIVGNARTVEALDASRRAEVAGVSN